MLTDEHGINPDGNYIGTSDVQLKYINVFFKQGMGKEKWVILIKKFEKIIFAVFFSFINLFIIHFYIF